MDEPAQTASLKPKPNSGTGISLAHWHMLSVEETGRELGSNPLRGLARSAACERLARYGPNRLNEPGTTSPVKLFLAQFNDLLIIILIVAALISGFVLREWLDAGAIGAILVLNAVLGFIQEYRAERALAALKKLVAPRARVIRDGAPEDVPAENLVPGDVIELAAGDRVPADVRLTEVHLLSINEASLTGESVPVDKTAAGGRRQAAGGAAVVPLGDRINMAYAATTITRGRARGLVVATGPTTEMGKVVELVDVEKDKTPLQVELRRLGARIACICIGVSVIVLVCGLLRGHPWAIMFLTAVSLAVAAIPEGLPAAVTVSLALGVKRMVGKNALVRRLHAVETLGSTSFICSDKTGTITINKMRVERIGAGSSCYTIPEAGRHAHELRDLLTAFVLCNDVQKDAEGRTTGDPLEVGLLVAAEELGANPAQLNRDFPRAAEIPFEAERKAMSTIHRERDGFLVLVKGAPETIFRECGRTGGEYGALNDRLTGEGYRTIAFALKRITRLPETLSADTVETGLTLLGLAALSDPPRHEVSAAIATCRQAGIRVAMVTGDHRLTAESVARSVGLIEEESSKAQELKSSKAQKFKDTDGTGECTMQSANGILTGAELEALPDEKLLEIAEDVHVYARVSPLQKVKIVKALKERGHVVAMTGDGVNDAPALRLADIGVAMGVTGTDVAREAADMVLLDDDFATIVAAVREGRTIFANLKKFVYFLISCNISEVLSVLFASLAGFPILAPIQILWMNLVTDGAPAMALGVDPVHEDMMQQPPRNPKESVLSLPAISGLLLQGVILTLGTVTAYVLAKTGGSRTDAEVRTIAAAVLVLSQLFHAFNFRVGTRFFFSKALFGNRWLVLALLVSLALQAATIYVPLLNPVFRTVPLGLKDLGLVLLCSLIPVLIINVVNRSSRSK